MLDRMRRGGPARGPGYLAEIGNAIGIMPGTTICGLADGAGWPVKNAVKKFRGELEEYIKSGQRRQELALVGTH